jgi:hypothetical protein
MGTTWTTSCRLASVELDSFPGFPSIATPQKKIENMVNSIGNQNHDLWVFGATIDFTGNQSINPLLLWNETPTPQRLGVGQFALIIWT